MRYHQRLSKAQAASSCPVAAFVFVMGWVGAADAFSLLCRTVSIVTKKNSVNGHTLPILLLLRVVMAQRTLAFTHTAADTLALATFMTTTFQTAKIEKTTEVLAKADEVPVLALDLAARVKVSFILCNIVPDTSRVFGEIYTAAYSVAVAAGAPVTTREDKD